MRNEKVRKLENKFKRLKREEKNMNSGKDAAKFIMKVIQIKQD
jgi:hypothetical protein